MKELSVVQFFDNLPPKQCRSCGAVLQEQADCYWNHCFECMDLHLVPFSLSPRYAVNRSSESA